MESVIWKRKWIHKYDGDSIGYSEIDIVMVVLRQWWCNHRKLYNGGGIATTMVVVTQLIWLKWCRENINVNSSGGWDTKWKIRGMMAAVEYM